MAQLSHRTTTVDSALDIKWGSIVYYVSRNSLGPCMSRGVVESVRENLIDVDLGIDGFVHIDDIVTVEGKAQAVD